MTPHFITLREEIEAFNQEAPRQIPQVVRDNLQQSIDELRRSDLVGRALQAGDLCPDFTLPNATGKNVSLGELLWHGPLILSFYRGIWCPYCNLELRAYQRLLGEIRAAGGAFAAISPQTPDHSLATAQKNALAFEVLSDSGNRIAAQFGLAYPIPSAVKQITASFGVDLAALNGGDDDRLPVSATYVIGKVRCIALAAIEPDFRQRLEPGAALAALRGLVASAQAAE